MVRVETLNRVLALFRVHRQGRRMNTHKAATAVLGTFEHTALCRFGQHR